LGTVLGIGRGLARGEAFVPPGPHPDPDSGTCHSACALANACDARGLGAWRITALAPWLASSRSRTDEVIWTQLPGTARSESPAIIRRGTRRYPASPELFNGVVTLGESHQRWGSHRNRPIWPASGQSVRPSAPHSDGLALPGDSACARLAGRRVWPWRAAAKSGSPRPVKRAPRVVVLSPGAGQLAGCWPGRRGAASRPPRSMSRPAANR
jgi:hypothetical protein